MRMFTNGASDEIFRNDGIRWGCLRVEGSDERFKNVGIR